MDAIDIDLDIQFMRDDCIKALEQLSTRDRGVIWLRFYEGKTFQGIADECHVSLNTSRIWVYGAIKRLARTKGGRNLKAWY